MPRGSSIALDSSPHSLASAANDVDPKLAKDVSNFLKALQLGDPVPEDTTLPENSLKKHQKSRPSRPLKQPRSPKRPVKSTLNQPHEPNNVNIPSKVSYDHNFVFHPVSKWYTAIPSLGATVKPSISALSPTQLSNLMDRAAELHRIDIRTFQSSSASSSASETCFLLGIIQSGTLSDRLSALTLLVQSSPLHNIQSLEKLRTMAERGKGKGGREECLKALRCIVDWWVGGGAPDRKLKYFRDQPLSHPSVTDKHLLAWYFEDWLKKFFFSILQILEILSLDSLPYVRTQVINLIFTLLRDKPEQEQNLLRLLVNKLGDTEKSICSGTSYHLLQLLQAHPAMKSVIVREVISLVIKPPSITTTMNPSPTGMGRHIKFTDDAEMPKSKVKSMSSEQRFDGNVHARYYSMITLNQIVLTPGDRDVARQLLDIYFEMFRELLGKGRDEDVINSQETGEHEEINKPVLDKAGRIRDGGRKERIKTKVKVELGVNGAAGFAEMEEHNSKLIAAALTGVNRALPFAKVDGADSNIRQHLDTLFLITHKSTFNISLQALVLIQQISSALSSTSSLLTSIRDRYYRSLYTSLHDTRLSTSSKQAMYLNLLFKSIKADAGNMDRVVALVRRFVQVMVSGGNGATEVVAGGLYLLGELFSSVPSLRSIVHQENTVRDEPYDPRKRDPQFAHARSSPLWELTPLLHHYHPTISLHAYQLLASQPLTASADLTQNTLSHFLDRFVYKNPKKSKGDGSAKTKGASAMQPAASGLDGQSVKILKMDGEGGAMGFHDNEFLQKGEQDIPVDQVFFHRYFSKKNGREKVKAVKKRQGSEMSETSDDTEKSASGEEASNLDEKEVWKAIKATMPRTQGEDGNLLEDSDDIPSDLGISDDEGEMDRIEDDEDAENSVLSLAEASDNEDLISLNADIPDGLIEYDGTGTDGEGEEWSGIEGEKLGKKRKREERKGSKRKKLRSLPTFASFEEYAGMIEEGEDDDDI
ncbi:hypothetical protein AMATHDRAFT_5130 [Amanita thiersii Skay4041]|uniref:CCAAT-binding factor domain-containing protein n=1 Tax=Amanita thiersii Skay4041 TaxID=703135 RepID=A0A2A9NGF4_9AGAR|nr:hypothetical protein AMATHDRAFT_5130 [Amanita thiersii Skay4041]